MSYEITIKRKDTTVQTVQEYKVIDTVEVEREERFYRSDDYEPKTRTKDVYGYVETAKPVTTETEVLKQTVDDLDLAAVIRAVNKL